MKHIAARALLILGYCTIIGTISTLLYHYAHPIAILLGLVLLVIALWLLIVWGVYGFLWAHSNWRKE